MFPDHASILETRHRLRWPDEEACAASARRLAAEPALRDASIALLGPLGAGKTTFVRHLLRALGVRDRIKSPTYALMERYDVAGTGPFSALHFDFYRFADAREWQDAGLREVFAEPGLKLIEWADNAAGMLAPIDLRIEISPLGPDERGIDALGSEGRVAEALTADSRIPSALAGDARRVSLLSSSARGDALLRALLAP